MQNEKILIVTTIHSPYDARIYERNILPLSKLFSIVVIAPWKPRYTENSNITWVETKMPKSRFKRIWHGWQTFLKTRNSVCSVVHFHDIDFIFWAFLIKTFSRKKVIYDCHENYPEEVLHGKPWIPIIFRRLLSIFVNLIETTLIRFFDCCIVVVPYQVEKFSQFNKNVVLIRNVSVYPGVKNQLKETNIIYIGSISENYGGESILSLARFMNLVESKLRIILFDKFDDSYKKKFITLVQEESLPIDLLPRFNRHELHEIMKKGIVGLSFSKNTISNNLGYPTKLFEYMSFGIPVVASDTLRHQQILNISKSGVLVDDENPQEVYSSILNLIEDTYRREELIKNGYEALENEFNWVHEEKKLFSAYYQLLA